MNRDDRRYRAAYHLLHAHIAAQIALGHLTGGARAEAERVLASVEAELNPPEFEEVEESAGWVNIYPPQGKCDSVKYNVTHSYPSQAMADENAASNRIGCQELRVKVMRPVKRAVIREYEVAAKVSPTGDVYGVDNAKPFHAITECHGKAGVLIFRTAE